MMGKSAPALTEERRTVYQLLSAAGATWGGAKALHQPRGDGSYESYSWNEYRAIAEEIALGLRSLGVGHGDIVGLASETRAEFYLADVGVMTNGSIAAAVYTSLPPMEQMKTIAASNRRPLRRTPRRSPDWRARDQCAERAPHRAERRSAGRHQLR